MPRHENPSSFSGLLPPEFPLAGAAVLRRGQCRGACATSPERPLPAPYLGRNAVPADRVSAGHGGVSPAAALAGVGTVDTDWRRESKRNSELRAGLGAERASLLRQFAPVGCDGVRPLSCLLRHAFCMGSVADCKSAPRYLSPATQPRGRGDLAVLPRTLPRSGGDAGRLLPGADAPHARVATTPCSASGEHAGRVVRAGAPDLVCA